MAKKPKATTTVNKTSKLHASTVQSTDTPASSKQSTDTQASSKQSTATQVSSKRSAATKASSKQSTATKASNKQSAVNTTSEVQIAKNQAVQQGAQPDVAEANDESPTIELNAAQLANQAAWMSMDTDSLYSGKPIKPRGNPPSTPVKQPDDLSTPRVHTIKTGEHFSEGIQRNLPVSMSPALLNLNSVLSGTPRTPTVDDVEDEDARQGRQNVDTTASPLQHKQTSAEDPFTGPQSSSKFTASQNKPPPHVPSKSTS